MDQVKSVISFFFGGNMELEHTLKVFNETVTPEFSTEKHKKIQVIYQIVNQTGKYYPDNIEGFNKFYLQFFAKFEERYKDKQTKLSLIPLLFWLYWFFSVW